jgi:hypothetical protein
MLDVLILSVLMPNALCPYDECHFPEYHIAEFSYAEYLYVECHYAEFIIIINYFFPVDPSPSIPSVNLVNPNPTKDDDIPPPRRTSSPALSPIPDDPNFVENILVSSF